MRRGLLGVGLFMVLVAAPAHAQFANRMLGLSIGYAKLTADNMDWALPLTLDGAYYIEAGFEATADFTFIYVTVATGKAAIGLLPAIGFRYLFLQETIRPYIGVDLSYFHIFSDLVTSRDLVGLGPKAGVEFFTSDSFALGVRANAGFYFALNQPLTVLVSVNATASVYF